MSTVDFRALPTHLIQRWAGNGVRHRPASCWRRRAVEVSLRIIADTLMINFSLLATLVMRFLFLVLIEDATLSKRETVIRSFELYWKSCPLLTMIGIGVFYAAGFYTNGRAYRGRYKALVIGLSVTVCYLAFGLLILLFGRHLSFPRSVFVLSWGVSLAMLLGARLWSRLWSSVIIAREASPRPSSSEKPIERVLVIGGAGYIGSALLPRLLERGYRVRLLDLFVYGQEPIRNLLDHPNLEVIRADFRQLDQVTRAMRGVDAAIHLGAIVGDPACALDEELTVDINLKATRMIAEIAKGEGIERFLFASTCSVYGASDEFLEETSALNPLSLYARSKLASESLLLSLADERFHPVIFRFGTIYGLSGRTRFDLVVNLLTAKAIVDRKITVMGGDQWRPFLHVEDAALALLRALEAPRDVVSRQIFNIGSDEQNATLGEIGALIHRLVPEAELLELGCDGDRRNYRVSFRKVRETLGFTPMWTLERGIQQVMEAFASQKVRDYKLSTYNNFKYLSEEGSERLARPRNDWAHALLRSSETAVGAVAAAAPVPSHV